MLDGRLAPAFAAIFGKFYMDAMLSRYTKTDNGKGGITKTFEDTPCKVQVDAATWSMRQAGYVEGDVRLLILADGLDTVTTDDEVWVPSRETYYRLSDIALDPAQTHWIARGRKRPL